MKIKTIAAGIAAAVMMGVMSISAFAAEKKPEPLIQAAAAIDDSLETVWGENRNVSYTLEDNAIFIALWDKGVNEDTFGGINNWDKRDVTLDFSFLEPDVTYKAELFTDSSDCPAAASLYEYTCNLSPVTCHHSPVTITMQSGGGFVMVLTQEE